MKNYFKRIKDILTYYDYEPLLFFLSIASVISHAQIWFSDFSHEVGYVKYFDLIWFNPNEFMEWLFLFDTLVGISIIGFLHNQRILLKLVAIKSIIILYINIPELWYIIKTILGKEELSFLQYFTLMHDVDGFYVWSFVWIWILIQMKKKQLYQRLKL
jgi:hypothetical protein